MLNILTPGNLASTIGLGEKLNDLFKTIKGKLLGDKNQANEKIAEAIGEINKFYVAVNVEITNFLSLDFLNPSNRQQNMNALFVILSGMLQVRIEEARGHCHKIKKIYETFLDKWLVSVLNQQEYGQVKQLFLELSEYDYSMLNGTIELEKQLQQKAQSVLQLVNANDIAGAVAFQSKYNMDLLTVQQRINHLLLQLITLKNEFSQLAGL